MELNLQPLVKYSLMFQTVSARLDIAANSFWGGGGAF